MPAWFTVLASGSSGNASLLEADGVGLLIDCGLRPDVLADRLAAVGRSWASVSAVLLTHTHGDHWHPATLAHLRRLGVPLWAHPRHHDALTRSADHAPLRRAGLARDYAAGEWAELGPGLCCLPVEVPHDSDPTFAFRIEAKDGLFGAAWAVGLASDLGHVPRDLPAVFAGVDVLAVEFNHDERMQRSSGRPRMLIDRVLGKAGHLSNAQAADLTRAVARSAGPDGLRYLVQLHLSRDCNRPDLAAAAGRAALDLAAPSAVLVTASQHSPTVPFPLTARAAGRRRAKLAPPQRSVQPSLPGLDGAPVEAR